MKRIIKPTIFAIFIFSFFQSVANASGEQYNSLFPPPFANLNSCDLAKKIFPEYNCSTRVVSNGRSGVITDVTILKRNEKDLLLAFLEEYYTPVDIESTPPGEPKVIYLAVFQIEDDKLENISTNEFTGTRWYGRADFDLAPYHLNKEETAIGVRVYPGLHGPDPGVLYLFRLVGERLENIFTKVDMFNGEALKINSDDELLTYFTVLQIIPQKQGFNKFKIVTRRYRVHETLPEKHPSLFKDKTTEIYFWNSERNEYEKE